MQLLVPSLGKFLCVTWNIFTKTDPQYATLRSFFKNVKRIEKICIDSEKSINSFK